MRDVKELSQYDLYFFVKPAAELALANEDVLSSHVTPMLGEGWAPRLTTDADAYRAAVEALIRESLETTGALKNLELMSQNVSQWRALATGVARTAPVARRPVLLKAAGYGLGSPRSPKEMKDLLLTIKSRLALHADEFAARGLARPLLLLPSRVLAQLEGGAGDVARERAEDSEARAVVAELHARMSASLGAVWTGAEHVAMEGLLLAAYDDASETEKEEARARAAAASALDLQLDEAFGAARVESRKRATTESLPPGLTGPEQPEQPAQPEAQSVA